MCMLPKEKGPCMQYVTRFYFDTISGKCAKFTYGSCHGNDNNFETLDECEDTCKSLINAAMNAKPMSIDMGKHFGLYFYEIIHLITSLIYIRAQRIIVPRAKMYISI